MCHAAELKILITKIYEKFTCEKCALEVEGNRRTTAWKRQQGGMIWWLTVAVLLLSRDCILPKPTSSFKSQFSALAISSAHMSLGWI